MSIVLINNFISMCNSFLLRARGATESMEYASRLGAWTRKVTDSTTCGDLGANNERKRQDVERILEEILRYQNKVDTAWQELSSDPKLGPAILERWARAFQVSPSVEALNDAISVRKRDFERFERSDRVARLKRLQDDLMVWPMSLGDKCKKTMQRVHDELVQLRNDAREMRAQWKEPLRALSDDTTNKAQDELLS